MAKNKILITGLLAVLAIGVAGLFFHVHKASAIFPTNGTILDNFNRADTGGISTSTTSSGYAWGASIIQGSGASTLGIASNQLKYMSAGANNAYIDHVFDADSEVYTTVNSIPLDGHYVALFDRIQNPGQPNFAWYGLVWLPNSSGTDTWSIRRYTGNSNTLADISAPALHNGDSIGMSVTGTGSSVTITVYQKVGGTWSTVGSINDTSGNRITTNGYLGIEVSEGSTRVDDFGGGNLIAQTTPTAPSLSLPADGDTAVSTTPDFRMRATDVNEDDLRYKIDVCTTSDCSTITRTIDQTASQVGWIGQDQQGSTAYAGSASLASSTLATYTYQAPGLDPDTQYWWRAYAIDPDGLNTFSSASTIQSFHTVTNPTPPTNNGGGATANTSTSKNPEDETPPGHPIKLK